MKIAITGGTGFVGRHLARSLARKGHEVALISRGFDRRDESIRRLPGIRFFPASTDDSEGLTKIFEGCDAVAHCAGINRELGSQTYARVHVEGTRCVVDAAKRAAVSRVVLLSFLRARPSCRSGYHESKWEAEEIVRLSGLNYTILKPGVIYGKGDHLLDHTSRALRTFRFFPLVGFRSRAVRPLAVEDLVRVLEAALLEDRLARKTVAVLGPEELTLGQAVRRIGEAAGVGAVTMPAPILPHYALAWILERLMTIPLASLAQVRILSEGLTQPAGQWEDLPEDLAPRTPFGLEQIRKGLPEERSFSRNDLRCCARARA